MMRRRTIGSKKLVFFQKRFYPAGNYTWTVPAGCREVDVFLVGGGGAGHNGSGGGGGYTKTFKKDTSGWRDGDAISVAPGQSIPITVGKGGIGGYSEVAPNGGYSQFLNSSYRANGGNGAGNGYPGGSNAGAYTGGNGGSGGAGDDSDTAKAGSDGSNGIGSRNENGSLYPAGSLYGGGKGQRHTTRDFGEPTGKRNAGGGGSDRNINGGMGGESDYDKGCGTGYGNRKSGGYGGGGCGTYGNGGDGTVLIRYWAYEE